MFDLWAQLETTFLMTRGATMSLRLPTLRVLCRPGSRRLKVTWTPLLIRQFGTPTTLTWLCRVGVTPVMPPVAVTKSIPDKLHLTLTQPLRKAAPRLGLSILSSVSDGLLRPEMAIPLILLRTTMGPDELYCPTARTTWFGTVLTQAWWRL